MPFTLTGITIVDHLKESGLKSVWEVWREYAYKTSLVVLSMFVLAPQVKFNCVNDTKDGKHQQLTSVEANAVNSYCKTHFMPWQTRYNGVFAFMECIILYLAANFWIHACGNKEGLRCLGKFISNILEHHMSLEEMKKIAVKPIKSSPDKRSQAVRENVLIILRYGECSKLWKCYIGRCFLLIALLCFFCVSSASKLHGYFHGGDDIVTCYIPKSEIDLGTGNFAFVCIDEFTMIDSMTEYVFLLAMCAQLVVVFGTLCQMSSLVKKCCCCDFSNKSDIFHCVILMAGLDDEQASIVTGFSKYVLHDVKNISETENGLSNETFPKGLLANEQEAKELGDDAFFEILRVLKASTQRINSPHSSQTSNSQQNQNQQDHELEPLLTTNY